MPRATASSHLSRVTKTSAIVFSPDGHEPPAPVIAWLDALALPVVRIRSEADLMALCLRGRPRLVLFDASRCESAVFHACARLKRDSFTGIVPAALLVRDADDAVGDAFAAGADEVLRTSLPVGELTVRLDALLRRSDRDVFVHPSTRLPGTNEIEAEIGRRLAIDERFATCYADLDHFKEYNDRYSYYDGDRVIRILAKILHDVVKGSCGEVGFVGHIGGDDFIFIIPVDAVQEVCGEIVAIFDALVPYQYSEQDRRAGYFFGKDRRGQLHRVPLMTVSIGIVTNERRRFSHAAQVSELVTEMKSYAKTLPGSVFTVDRRQDPLAPGAGHPAETRPDPLGAGAEES